jgi:hypothetical protein
MIPRFYLEYYYAHSNDNPVTVMATKRSINCDWSVQINQLVPRFPFTSLGSFFSFEIPKTSKQRSFMDANTYMLN